jgi:hypothetical protein
MVDFLAAISGHKTVVLISEALGGNVAAFEILGTRLP